jgi:(p)ppGpp synthase/HD superfamily hydrolase
MKQSEIAESIARTAHAGQFRRDGVTPYIEHCQAVVNRLRGESDEVIAAAWLHDCIENTNETWDSLERKGVSTIVCAAVWDLTRRMGVNNLQYIAKIKSNPLARKVKIADMLSNLADQPTNKQIIKYAHGLIALVEK